MPCASPDLKQAGACGRRPGQVARGGLVFFWGGKLGRWGARHSCMINGLFQIQRLWLWLWPEWNQQMRTRVSSVCNLAGPLPCCPGFNTRRRDLNFGCDFFDMADITLVVERSGSWFSKLPRRRHGFCLVFCVGMGGNLLCGGYYAGVWKARRRMLNDAKERACLLLGFCGDMGNNLFAELAGQWSIVYCCAWQGFGNGYLWWLYTYIYIYIYRELIVVFVAWQLDIVLAPIQCGVSRA